MKITIEAEPQEVAALVDEIQKQQRPIYLYGIGIKKYLEENPDLLKEAADPELDG